MSSFVSSRISSWPSGRQPRSRRSRAIRHVAVLIETSRAYGRGLVRGVARYNREKGGWLTCFQPHGLDDPPPQWLKDWKGDGILARIGSRQMANLVLRAGVPVVDLRGMLPNLGIPLITVDNQALAQLAAEHLLRQGFRRFGFCGFPAGSQQCMDDRRRCFVRIIEQSGFECRDFQPPRGRPKGNVWEWEQRHLARWIKTLPKPVGVMACNDDRGMQVLDACRRAGVRVPDEAAVVGVDNDEYLCELSVPPLTSIDVHSALIGYEAAALLDRMMAGQPAPKTPKLLPPRAVMVRPSTDVLVTEDPDVVRAVSFIRQHACHQIQVADVLRHVQSSRTSLEPKLRRMLGRTIHQEIHRLQIERVKELLTATDLPIKQIASQAGFKYMQYLSRAFRRATGLSPIEYRNRMRGR